jgi:hypothetical protein
MHHPKLLGSYQHRYDNLKSGTFHINSELLFNFKKINGGWGCSEKFAALEVSRQRPVMKSTLLVREFKDSTRTAQ